MSAGDSDPAPDLTLRPATPEDRFRIRRWLTDAGSDLGWGTAASTEAEITLAMESPSALCRMVERTSDSGALAHTAIGYAQAADIALVSDMPEDLASGTWDVRVLLAPASDGAMRLVTLERTLALITQEVFATSLAVACSALVPVSSEAAVRSYERAGFRWLRIRHDAALGPAWLMLRERPR